MMNLRRDNISNTLCKYDKVMYIPNHADSSVHPDCKIGYVSSLTDSYIFVKFEQQLKHMVWDEVTSQACLRKNIKRLNGQYSTDILI